MILKRFKPSESGQAIVIIILIVMVFLILIPLNVFFLDQESKFSVMEKRTTSAFHCAEQGADRGYWKLLEKQGYWAAILAGTQIDGYCFDVVYTSTFGGTYAVNITTTDDTKERKIISIGRSADGSEIRTVEIILRKSLVEGAIQAKGVTSMGAAEVHWGPVLSTTQIDPTSKAFPVLRSKLGIAGAAATCVHSGHNLGRPDTTPPQSNSTAFCTHAWYPAGWYQWQNFDTDITDPTVDLNALKLAAQSQGRYYTTAVAGDGNNINDDPAVVGGMAYATYLATYYTPSKVRYFDLSGQEATFSGGTFMEGTIIVINGNLNFSGNHDGDYYWPVPAEAWKQYCAINTAAAGQWPGDAAGMPTPTSAFQDAQYRFAHPGQKISFHGIIYVKNGVFKMSGNTNIHGAVIVVNGSVTTVGNPGIFYDPDVANYVGFDGAITRTSWREIKMAWPF
ncbi:MAG: hypothetical protein A2297_00865 [Elusimicrobia bacterium RIFOXYB2_FULL_48_7]|nr:MAG: hypothetical protein A2297_00865 [Elusimicrobia bacterium RIFOXYB2_FULL_48_7]